MSKKPMIARIKVVSIWGFSPKPLIALQKRAEEAHESRYFVYEIAMLDDKPLALIGRPKVGSFWSRMLLAVRGPHRRLLERSVPKEMVRKHLFALAKRRRLL